MKKQEPPQPGIDIPLQTIAHFCSKNYIEKLALFGSVLTPRFRKSSDVDVLVEFKNKHVPGLIRVAELEIELGEILGRSVDLRTPSDLSPYFRNEVVTKAYHIYGKKRFHSC